MKWVSNFTSRERDNLCFKCYLKKVVTFETQMLPHFLEVTFETQILLYFLGVTFEAQILPYFLGEVG
jgi:hypothetical protein